MIIWSVILRGTLERARQAECDAIIGAVLTAKTIRTRDLGGTASTLEFADAVCREM